MTPIGSGMENRGALKGLNVPPTGAPGYTFPLATKTLLIAAKTATLHALDKATGEIVANLPLKDAEGKALGNVSGAPITYMHGGKQYIVMPMTTGRKGEAHMVALALP